MGVLRYLPTRRRASRHPPTPTYPPAGRQAGPLAAQQWRQPTGCMAARCCVWRPQCSRDDGDVLHDCLACGGAFHHACAATHGGQEDNNLCGRGLALVGAVAGCREGVTGVTGALNAQQPENDGDDALDEPSDAEEEEVQRQRRVGGKKPKVAAGNDNAVADDATKYRWYALTLPGALEQPKLSETAPMFKFVRCVRNRLLRQRKSLTSRCAAAFRRTQSILSRRSRIRRRTAWCACCASLHAPPG